MKRLLAHLVSIIILSISHSATAYEVLQCVSDKYIFPKTQKSGLSNPAERGKYKFDVITYGEKPFLFSIDKPDIITPTITLPSFLAEYSKNQGYKYDAYHTFESANLALDGKVWFPDTSEKKPVILLVHGNSDPGFDYLGELFSSRGYVVVQVDQTYLNGLMGESGARGWVLLEHLKLLRSWNRKQDSIFYNKLDLENIALIGMSRGGEAVSLASTFNNLKTLPNSDKLTEFGFGIKSVVALAPMDGQYQHANGKNILRNTNYLVLQGGHDADVYQFLGSQQWQRTLFDDGNDYVKYSIYVYKANHINFNQDMSNDTHWGGSKRFYKKLLSPKQQEQLTKVFVSAFIDLTLLGKKEYENILRRPPISEFDLPKDIYVSRYITSAFQVIENFDILNTDRKRYKVLVDAQEQLGMPSIVKEQLRGGVDTPNNVLALKLKKQVETSFQVKLAPIDGLTMKDKFLTFAIAVLGSEKNRECSPYNLLSDIKIEILNKYGVVINQNFTSQGSISPLLTSDYSELENKDVSYPPTEPLLQTVVFPIELIAESSNTDEIILNISFTPSQNMSIILDDIGIAR
ncbi:hypothetical protein [Pseudoalteromonas piscicida]|uniref:hypothetical protein n=1 Tax=Pseudoalteromonas piscicida TaxID=43662 RepID=UPI0027E3F760|nr:hypothetical protein [Pseudoalteromonas piscicida]WMO16319.1 hypothetical protein NI376_24195 [Pseudoalteromonas piscicida]